jgi:hypothetical protein
MKARTALIPLTVLAAAALGGRWAWLERPGPAAPAEAPRGPGAEPSLKPAPPVAPEQARPGGPPAATAPRRIAVAAPGPAEDGKTVAFEVVEGDLAVAYGDVILGKVEQGATLRNGRYEPPALQLWERPEIPYAINPELPNPARVQAAIDYFNQHTPVSFVPYANQADAIVFEQGEEHCYSALGRQGGLQPIRLSAGCQTQEILHEMMHALGFVHEQSRPDRDQYVQVLWDNIEEKYQPQFAIVPDSLMEAERGTSFDYRSIMLYRPDAFAARPGLTTLQPQAGRPAIEPAAQGLSDSDIQRLKRLYRL